MKNLEKLAELALALPAELQANAIALVAKMGEVIEGFGDRPLEWKPETLKLVQGTSDRGKLPRGASIGSLVIGEEIAATPLKVIPIRTGTTRQYWDPNPDNPKVLCNSPDGKLGYQYGDCGQCHFSKFDEVANKSQCNKAMTILTVAADLSKVVVVNFAKTNYMNGKDWENTMKRAGVAPYKRIYALSSQTSTKSKNVELIKADVVQDNKVEGAALAFVEELSRISGEDRKISLEKFYEYVKARASNAQLSAPKEVQLLTDNSEGDSEVISVGEVVTSEDSTETSTQAKTGKRYKL